ncbi:hypothetical protein BIW11_08994 [Tropilaelaps mercedesae]|uniref:Uncharacterized protein n=1 Tax=Tropilaelaps mercedesae TaxID=418985 RepID=A0A1V9XM02_9ACAR|nr:hypothetical protein BIW11_08994 [Tropilaelaps mercedesae]
MRIYKITFVTTC